MPYFCNDNGCYKTFSNFMLNNQTNENAFSYAYFYTYGIVNVKTFDAIPLMVNSVLYGKNIEHNEGSGEVILKSGIYYVSYNLCGAIPRLQNGVGVSIYINDEIIPESAVYTNASENNSVVLGGNLIVEVKENAIMNIKNMSNSSVDFCRIMFSIIQLG